jgi:fermentation-respiration switch protein FrsA (DUF1100 family)
MKNQFHFGVEYYKSISGGESMKKSARRILIGSGLAAAGAGLAGTVHLAVTKYMVNVALDRQIPKHTGGAEKKLAGSEVDQRFLHTLRQAGETLRQQGGEIVQTASRDGTKLVGHWFGQEKPQRTIVAMHGWRSSWFGDFGMIADFWFQNGCNVLFAEQRGQGESGGEYMGFGLLERHDCVDWVRWANEHHGTLPVYLCGISMGASTVLMAAGLELPENVRGIIADCGYTSPEAIWKHVAKDNLGLSYGTRSAAARDLCRKKIQVGIDDYSCVDAMQECEVPVLFIHGTDDRFVPIEMTYENYKACTAPKRLLVVPGAGHGMSYYLDQSGYENALRQFWKDFDTKNE